MHQTGSLPHGFSANRLVTAGVSSYDEFDLVERCHALMHGAVPAYVLVGCGGGKMYARMVCLGRHWNPKIYQYEAPRTDFDALAVPPLPQALLALAKEIAASVGVTPEPSQ